jgi:hypothetical protein
VVQVAECLEWDRQPLLAFGKRRRMQVQVLGQFRVTAAIRHYPQVESKQMNPSANLKVAPGLLPPGRLDQPSKDRYGAGAGRLFRAGRLLILISPTAMRAALAAKRVSRDRADDESRSVRIGIPGQAGGQLLVAGPRRDTWQGRRHGLEGGAEVEIRSAKSEIRNKSKGRKLG